MQNFNKATNCNIKDIKINFINTIFQDLNNINTIKLMSLLSLVFKETFQNDKLIQDFEVYFLRKENYKITTFRSLIQTIEYCVKENFEKQEKEKDLLFKCVSLLENILKKIDTNISNNEVTNNKIDPEKFIEAMDVSLKENSVYILEYIETTSKKQTIISFPNEKKYSLTPTVGIKMLNNNPYSFFVEKILGLKQIDGWTNNIDACLYGTLVHEIMQIFAEKCNKIKSTFISNKDNKYTKINIKNEFKKIFNETTSQASITTKIKINNFFKKKLLNIENIAVEIEYNAFKNNRIVFAEKSYSAIIDGIKVYAKADRIEIDSINQDIYIYDFKSGSNIPTKKDEENGSNPQLLIIAMLISKQYKNFHIKNATYVDISGKKDCKDEEFSITDSDISDIENNIKQQIKKYFHNGEPNIDKMSYIRPSLYHLYDKDVLIMKLYRNNFIYIK